MGYTCVAQHVDDRVGAVAVGLPHEAGEDVLARLLGNACERGFVQALVLLEERAVDAAPFEVQIERRGTEVLRCGVAYEDRPVRGRPRRRARRPPWKERRDHRPRVKPVWPAEGESLGEQIE